MATLEGQLSAALLSPSLNELGPALFLDENGNHFRTLGVIAPNSAGDSGLTAGVVADGAISQVTARQGDAQIVAAGKPPIPVVALVGINPATGDAIPFVAASAAKVTGKFQSPVETGSGAQQSIPHGLGVAPSLVLVAVQNPEGLSAWSIVEGTHTSTNILITVTNTVLYKVIAFA